VLLGLPPTFALSVDALEQAYRKKSLQVHPDRCASAKAKERRIAVERTAALNEAYGLLKSDEARAAYLVQQAGVRMDDKPDPALLMELMDAREQADENASHRAALAMRTEQELQALQRGLARQFESAPVGQVEPMRAVAQALTRIRYLRRLHSDLLSVRDHDDALSVQRR
jgi:molecular chaperone HscB